MNSRSYYDAFSNLQLQSRYSTKVALWSRTTFRAAVTLCLATSSCKPTCQNHLPEGSQHHSCFAARSRANAFCHSRLQARKAGASNQIDQHSRSPGQWGRFRATPRMAFLSRFLCQIELSPTVPCTFCRPHLPRVPRTLSLQSGAHFPELIFQKCSDGPNASVCLTF